MNIQKHDPYEAVNIIKDRKGLVHLRNMVDRFIAGNSRLVSAYDLHGEGFEIGIILRQPRNTYKAACCQAPFSFKPWITPLVVNRAGGFLKREACICLERTSIRAGLILLSN